MRIPAPLSAACLLVACATGAPGTGPAPEARSALRPASTPPLPRELPGFELVDTMAWDDPNMGISYRYRGPGDLIADAYLYPVPPAGVLCQGACRTEVAEGQVEEFRTTVPLMVERRYLDSVTNVRVRTVQPEPGAWVGEGRHMAFTLYREGKPLESHLVVFSGQEQFVKVRTSAAPGTGADSVLGRFVRDLVASVPPPYTCARGLYSGNHVTVSSMTARPTDSVVAAVDRAFTGSGYALAYRAPEAGRWRTAPRFDWPDSSEALVDRDAGMTLAGVLRAVDDSIQVILVASPACAMTNGEQGTTFATLEALKLANAYNTASGN